MYRPSKMGYVEALRKQITVGININMFTFKAVFAGSNYFIQHVKPSRDALDAPSSLEAIYSIKHMISNFLREELVAL